MNKFLKNVGAILAEQEQIDHVVKQLASDINDFVPFNEVYATAFTSDFPARSAVEVMFTKKDVKLKSKLSLRLINQESSSSFFFFFNYDRLLKINH